jgi:hypothetical protein
MPLKISRQLKYENTIASSARGLIFSLFNFTKKQPTEFRPKKQFQWLKKSYLFIYM